MENLASYAFWIWVFGFWVGLPLYILGFKRFILIALAIYAFFYVINLIPEQEKFAVGLLYVIVCCVLLGYFANRKDESQK